MCGAGRVGGNRERAGQWHLLPGVGIMGVLGLEEEKATPL